VDSAVLWTNREGLEGVERWERFAHKTWTTAREGLCEIGRVSWAVAHRLHSHILNKYIKIKIYKKEEKNGLRRTREPESKNGHAPGHVLPMSWNYPRNESRVGEKMDQRRGIKFSLCLWNSSRPTASFRCIGRESGVVVCERTSVEDHVDCARSEERKQRMEGMIFVLCSLRVDLPLLFCYLDRGVFGHGASTVRWDWVRSLSSQFVGNSVNHVSGLKCKPCVRSLRTRVPFPFA